MFELNLSMSSMFSTVDVDRFVVFRLRLPEPGSSSEVVVKNL